MSSHPPFLQREGARGEGVVGRLPNSVTLAGALCSAGVAPGRVGAPRVPVTSSSLIPTSYVQPLPFVSFPGKVLIFGTPSFTLSPPCSSVPSPGGGRGFLASCSHLAPVKPKWFPSPRAVPVPGAGAAALGWTREWGRQELLELNLWRNNKLL